MYNTNKPKEKQLLSTSKDLFWKFGIKRVTIEEICSEAGVSKMTFYKYFKNKNDLIKKILENLIESTMEKYRKIMASDLSYPEKIRESIKLKMEQTNDMSREFFNDFYKNANPDLTAYFNKMAQNNIQLIQNDFVDAQKKGYIRSSIKPEFIFYFLNHMFEMVEDNRLAQIYDSPQTMIMELTNFFFYGVLPESDRN
jgi:AcrR family transcriptional regulator